MSNTLSLSLCCVFLPLPQVNNATEEQVAAAAARVMATVSDTFDDDMFADSHLNLKKYSHSVIYYHLLRLRSKKHMGNV